MAGIVQLYITLKRKVYLKSNIFLIRLKNSDNFNYATVATRCSSEQSATGCSWEWKQTESLFSLQKSGNNYAEDDDELVWSLILQYSKHIHEHVWFFVFYR